MQAILRCGAPTRTCASGAAPKPADHRVRAHRADRDRTPPGRASALDWIESRQNPDGAFGESVASYADPREAGRGASMGSITGFALWALSAGGRYSDCTALEGLGAWCRAMSPRRVW